VIARVLVASIALHASASVAAGASPEKEVRAALAHYATLVRTMDHAGIAAMFAADGEIVNPGQAPVRGPVAIEAFLRQFDAYKVLSETMHPARTTVSGERATQTGTYRQRVRVPDGRVMDVSGGFEADWIRDAGGAWRIRRLATTPSAPRSPSASTFLN